MTKNVVHFISIIPLRFNKLKKEKQAAKEKQSLKEYGRGVIGGLLFGLPLMYTMEVWWTGFVSSPEKLIAYVAGTFLLLLAYNKFAGIREDSTFREICSDSVMEIGVAFMVTFLFLLLLGRITWGMSLYEIAGKTVVESMIMAIGVSVGTAQLGEKDNGESGMKDNKNEPGPKERNKYLELVMLSICGATLVASNVAPTEEIMVIGVQSSSWQLLLIVLVSLFLSAVVLYFSDFRGSVKGSTDMEVMALHILLTYIVALLVSVILLWFFGRLNGLGFHVILSQTIVLAVPAIMGASAGRLLIKMDEHGSSK